MSHITEQSLINQVVWKDLEVNSSSGQWDHILDWEIVMEKKHTCHLEVIATDKR